MLDNQRNSKAKFSFEEKNPWLACYYTCSNPMQVKVWLKKILHTLTPCKPKSVLNSCLGLWRHISLHILYCLQCCLVKHCLQDLTLYWLCWELWWSSASSLSPLKSDIYQLKQSFFTCRYFTDFNRTRFAQLSTCFYI